MDINGLQCVALDKSVGWRRLARTVETEMILDFGNSLNSRPSYASSNITVTTTAKHKTRCRLLSGYKKHKLYIWFR